MNEYKLDLVFEGEVIASNQISLYSTDVIRIIKHLFECFFLNGLPSFDNYKIISEGAFLIYYLNGVYVNSYKVKKLTTKIKEDVNFDEIVCSTMGSLYILKEVDIEDVWTKENERKDSYLYSMAKEFIEENTLESSLVASLLLEIYARENIKN